MATTVATAITAIRERLDEATASQWSEIMLRRWLNEGLRDIGRRTYHYQTASTLAVVAGTGTYTADADIIRINQVYFQPTADTTQKIPLQARTWAAMDEVWGNRQDLQSGYPVMFATRGYSPQVIIKLFPVPSVAGTLFMNTARMPANLDIAGGTGNIDCPEAWVEIAYFYCEFMARRKDKDYEGAKDSFEQYGLMIDNMITNGDYLNATDEFVFHGAGWLPGWLVDPNWS